MLDLEFRAQVAGAIYQNLASGTTVYSFMSVTGRIVLLICQASPVVLVWVGLGFSVA